MEIKRKNEGKFSQSLTLKAIIIAVLILLLLIPNMMIQDLIWEREQRSIETIDKINEKWSQSQTICGPVLTIPFTTTYWDSDKKTYTKQHELHLTPENLHIVTRLFPEERYYGIYKTILYKSEIDISGQFASLDKLKMENSVIHFDKAYLSVGLSDLRGVTNQLEIQLNDKPYAAEVGTRSRIMDKRLVVNLKNAIHPETEEPLKYDCKLQLNGSSHISFIPIGSTSKVEIEGAWKSPGFIGSFTPEYTLTENGFKAAWSVLSFNRDIPENWVDEKMDSFNELSFGVNLVDTVDHYQQNMRSAKYSLMFITLTFVVLDRKSVV